jgi:hypothetical protein
LLLELPSELLDELELLSELLELELLLEVVTEADAAAAAAALLELVAVALDLALLPPFSLLLPPLFSLLLLPFSFSLPPFADFSDFSFSAAEAAASADAFIEYVRLFVPLGILKTTNFELTAGLPALFAVLTIAAPVVSYGIIAAASKCAPRFQPA